MASSIPSFLERMIREGSESLNVELKSKVPLVKVGEKLEFARDICALANATPHSSYFVIGVNDYRNRVKNKLAAFPGILVENEDSYGNDLANIVRDHFINYPQISAEFYNINKVRICVVKIDPNSRPHMLNEGKIYLRNNTGKREARHTEIVEMIKERSEHLALISVCEDLYNFNRNLDINYHALCARFIIDRMSNLLESVEADSIYRCSMLLSKSYFLIEDYQRAIEYIDIALENKIDAQTLFIKAQIMYKVCNTIFLDCQGFDSFEISGLVRSRFEMEKCLLDVGNIKEMVFQARKMGGHVSGIRELDGNINNLEIDSKYLLERINDSISSIEN